VTRRALPAALVALLALAGCGVGAGPKPAGVDLIVQQDFGAKRIGTAGAKDVRGQDTVIRLLERSFKVKTRYGGRFVQAIGDLAGGMRGGRPVDWFYYVNGIEAPKGAADTPLHSGDRIIWDYHDWGAAQDVPAIVGSFPEPFRRGSGGTRLPVRVECADGPTPPCRTVQHRLTDTGNPVATGTLGSGSETDSYRVLVGSLTALASDPAVQRLDRGLRASGVYAVPRDDGRALTVLDPRGRTVRTLRAGTGLVAALKPPGSQPVWVVTGTDDAGVDAAAHALSESALAGKFAVVAAGGRVTGLPEAGA
jgi:hypothetical protein